MSENNNGTPKVKLTAKTFLAALEKLKNHIKTNAFNKDSYLPIIVSLEVVARVYFRLLSESKNQIATDLSKFFKSTLNIVETEHKNVFSDIFSGLLKVMDTYFKLFNEGKIKKSGEKGNTYDFFDELIKSKEGLEKLWEDDIFKQQPLSSVLLKTNTEERLKELVEKIKNIEDPLKNRIKTLESQLNEANFWNDVHKDLYSQLKVLVKEVFDSAHGDVNIEYNHEYSDGCGHGNLITNLKDKFNEYEAKNKDILNERDELKNKVSELETKVNELEAKTVGINV